MGQLTSKTNLREASRREFASEKLSHSWFVSHASVLVDTLNLGTGTNMFLKLLHEAVLIHDAVLLHELLLLSESADITLCKLELEASFIIGGGS
mmetsp:Transcript_65673/g.173983  ORF Transcript_65673/g.173983 Transcript_65673/m.173983 type:complete len:94 (+) Transcript_65673:410-691(+)